MRRFIPLLVLALLLCVWPVAVAIAGGDDDIPGTPLSVGGSVTGTVDAADQWDIYSVELTAGAEVYIRLDPGNVAGNKGNIHVFAPGASSISESQAFDDFILGAEGGKPWVDKHGAYFYYIPARSGTYYFGVEWAEGTLDYGLSVARTSRAVLQLAPDADDVPGTALGSGTVAGVVSSRADRYDVYAVSLVAGQQATIQLAPVVPYENPFEMKARVSLLKPGTTLAGVSSGTVAGPAEAVVASAVGDRKTATLQYTPAATGTYYVLVEAGPFSVPYYPVYFAYELTTAGVGGASGGGSSGGGSFSDVSGSAYADAIGELAGRGIIAGFDDGTFRPNVAVTRQQFAKMIVKTLGYTVTGSEVCPFTDVPVQSGSDPLYPSKYVAVCALRGITSGKTPTTFDPGSTITHQQLISMVARAAALDEPPAGYAPPFKSSQFSLADHYANARRAAWAGLLDGLQGMGAAYDFGGPSTRGECAQVLYNLLSKLD
jgi:hypothetical protein